MGIVCPSCDVEPAVDATAGGPCSACDARLVVVATDDNLIGSVIDQRFEVLGRLGAGGMGVVYRARQRSIDREVALKVLDRRVAQDVWSAPTLTSLFTQKLEVDAAIANVPAALRPLIRSLLDARPALRPTAAQAQATLRRFDPALGAPTALELELDPEPVVAPPPDLSFPETISLVDLDERGTPAPAPALAPSPTIVLELPVPPPIPTARAAIRFDPPPDPRARPFGGGELLVEPEPSLELELEAKPPAPPPPMPAPRKQRQLGPWFALLLIAGAAGGIVLYLKRQAAPAAIKSAAAVAITITAKRQVEVVLDGHAAGKTPLTLNLRASTSMIVISGGGEIRQITPDHDQSVDLSPHLFY